MKIALVFIRKDGTTQSFSLPSPVTFIGRRQDCDMCIPLSMVSRRHCEIFSEFGKLFVRDLRSRNGTFVNGKSVEEAEIKAGDELHIGPVHLVVQIDGVPASFEKYMPKKNEPVERAEPAAAPDETQEAELENISDTMNEIAGQSQTMDIDNIFLGDDFDLDSDIT